MGPLVTKEAHTRVNGLIDRGVEQKAQSSSSTAAASSYRAMRTAISSVAPCSTMSRRTWISTRPEIFGPVLSVVRAKNYEEALDLPMKHEYGNGVAIFTRDGDAARDFASRINIGMIGINVPIPVPLAYHSFGGWKASSFGDLNQHGTDSIKFWTKTKTITARWPSGIKDGAEFVMPTM